MVKSKCGRINARNESHSNYVRVCRVVAIGIPQTERERETLKDLNDKQCHRVYLVKTECFQCKHGVYLTLNAGVKDRFRNFIMLVHHVIVHTMRYCKRLLLIKSALKLASH